VDGAPFRTLNRALQTLGSRDRLAAALGVSTADVERYLAGKQAPPNYVFLAALDIVASGPDRTSERSSVALRSPRRRG